MTRLKVNLYKVVPDDHARPIEQLLAEMAAVALADRVRRVGYHDVRLEHILPPHTVGNETAFWLLDFIKLRYDHGPGKAGKTTAIQGFQLLADEGFGEETAALYDPATGYMVVQYNHHGVRASSIRTYLSEFYHGPEAEGGYALRVKLDDTSEQKLAAKEIITKLSFKVAPDQMRAAHRNNNVSLERALAINNDQAGGAIELTISAPRGQHLLQRGVTGLISTLRDLRNADRDEGTGVVSRFTVEAKADIEDRAEKIDMLLPALQLKLEGLVLGPDRRYTLESRWLALQRARRAWRHLIE